MEISLSKNIHLDREILFKLSDEDLLNCCRLNKYFLNKVCDDLFFKVILQTRYFNTLEFFNLDENETYKKYYLNVVYYITKMKIYYNFSYSAGSPKISYDLFKIYLPINNTNMNYLNNLLIGAVCSGCLEIIKYGVNLGANIHMNEEYLLTTACTRGYLNIVKYLVELGANIHIHNGYILTSASSNGHLEIVKYLIDLDPTERRIRKAHKYGKLNIVKYLCASNLFSIK